MEGFGVDLGVLWTGVDVGRGTKFAALPVFDSDHRVAGILFGPSWALPRDGTAEFADKVRDYQHGRGGEPSPAVRACYFGWVKSYSAVAFVTKDMGSISANINNSHWSFMTGTLPPSDRSPMDIQNIVMAYGQDLAADVMGDRKTLKAAADSAVSSGRGYKVSVIACTPSALSE